MSEQQPQARPARPQQSCAARMLDIRSYVLAARNGMAGAEPAAALALVAVFTLISLLLLPLWMAFDLSSTWEFTSTLRNAAEPVINDATASAAGVLGMSMASFLAALILTSFTLLPTLFELAFPSFAHPLLSIALWASLIFDYVTDWGKSWETTAAWAGENPVLHAVYCTVFCLFMSVGVQALLVVSVTVIIFGVLTIAFGRRPKAALTGS